MTGSNSLPDRFLGCLLGHAVGDAVAAPYEGLDAQTIYYNFGSTRALVDEPLQVELCYTDDTQLSIAVAEAMLERGQIEDESLSRAFVANLLDKLENGPKGREHIRNLAERLYEAFACRSAHRCTTSGQCAKRQAE